MHGAVELIDFSQLNLETHDPQETRAFGAALSKRLSAGDVLCLRGDLGAGKTTCIQGICSGLGVAQSITSPTFTLINEYQGVLPVYHFDFYRIAGEWEVNELGLEEYFYGDGVCLIEWPERIESLLPPRRYEIHLVWNYVQDANLRLITVSMPR